MNKPLIIAIAFGVLVVTAGYFWYAKERDSVFPYLHNPANHPVTEIDVRQIKQLIHEKGEHFLVSINIEKVSEATALAGHDSFRPKSGRLYAIERIVGGWKITKVENWKN